jgi:type II secretion system protein L
MSTLRVLLAAPPTADRADPWALFGADGRCVRQGRDLPAAWPRADAQEAVLAASTVRMLSLALPPMPAAKLASAAEFALEDRLAAPTGDLGVAISAQRADGSVLAAVVSKALLDAVRAQGFARAVPEPALVDVQAAWVWCASAAEGGFVRLPDGGAFAVGAASGDTLPAELSAAIAQARRGDSPVPAVIVAQNVREDALARWSDETGVRFVSAAEWTWRNASAQSFTRAPAWVDHAADAPAEPRRILRLFRPAVALAATALVVHVLATIVQWGSLRIELWRTERAITSLAQSAALPAANAQESARAIARRHSELRHRAGQDAPADALPMLARAAPALASLPGGALKSATYATDAWTIDMSAVDATTLAGVTRALTDAGIVAVVAPRTDGVRMRLTLP